MFQLKHALGVIAAIAGFILMLNILMLNINDIADVFVSNPIVFLILLAAAIVLIWFILKPLIEKIDEEERIAREKQEEERRRDEERRRRERIRIEAERRRQAEERERNTLRFKCPYCGKEYTEYPANPKEMLRVCSRDGCSRLFYLGEDQTPRTQEDAKRLAAEQRDIARIHTARKTVMEEYLKIHNHFFDRCGSITFHLNEVIFAYYEPTTHHIPLPEEFETTEGLWMLAKACVAIYPDLHLNSKYLHPSVVQIYWHPLLK